MSFPAATPFTAEDDAFIRNRWSASTVELIARDLRRHRDSVERRAEQLGLRSKSPWAQSVAEERAIRAATFALGRRIREVAARHRVRTFDYRGGVA